MGPRKFMEAISLSSDKMSAASSGLSMLGKRRVFGLNDDMTVRWYEWK